MTSIISQHHKRENLGVIKKFEKDRIYYCDKCGFLAARKEKLKSHMEAVHRDGDLNVTSVTSQQHKRGNLGVIKEISQGLNLLL